MNSNFLVPKLLIPVIQKAALEIHEMEKKSNAARALMQDTVSQCNPCVVNHFLNT